MIVSGAVLAGGQSRRMKRDKALLDWNGKPLIAHVLDQLQQVRPQFHSLMIVGDREPYHQFGVEVVPDLLPAAGPLGGIATALRTISGDAVFVVACDMPFLNPRLIGAMLEFETDADVLVPWRSSEETSQGLGGVFEGLHALYRRSCLPAIERRLAEGDRQVVSFYDDVRVEIVTERWMKIFDPDLRSLINVNRPEEFEDARDMAC